MPEVKPPLPFSRKFVQTTRAWRLEQNRNYEMIQKYVDDSYSELNNKK